MTLLDLKGDYATDVRPARNADGRKAWAKDPSGPTGTDGTRLDSTFVNDLLGMFRYLVSNYGLTVEPGDDTAIVQAIGAAIEGLAPLLSPVFTGQPKAPTADPGDNSQQIANTAFVAAAVAALVNSSPASLDTIKELADALGDDPNFATTITTLIGQKLAKASNLSDLADAPTARSNLGLGALAVLDGSASGQALIQAVSFAAMRNGGFLNIDSIRNNIGDADAVIAAAGARVIGTSAALTAPRAWILPQANSLNPGQQMLVADFFGGVTPTNKITLARAGSDTINGAASIDLAAANGAILFVSDGVSKWTAQFLGTAGGALLAANNLGDVLNAVIARANIGASPFAAMANQDLLINGGMRISQENGANVVTLTATGSVVRKYIADQWSTFVRGSFVVNAQQVTDAPPGYLNSLKFSVGTAQASLGANDEMSIYQPVEGTNAAFLGYGGANAKSAMIGFWVKAHRAGAYSGAIKNTKVGDASPRSYPFSFTINAADTWEYKTVSIPGDTAGAWATSAVFGLVLVITVAAGTTRCGAASAWAGSDYSGAAGTTNGVAATTDVFQLTGVSFIPGSDVPNSADAWRMQRSFASEYWLCQRYYEMSYGAAFQPGSNANATYNSGMCEIQQVVAASATQRWDQGFKAPKRVVPSAIAIYNPSAANSQVRNSTTNVDCASTTVFPSENKFVIETVMATGSAVGNTLWYHWSADARM
jgi:hypothetical protein